MYQTGKIELAKARSLMERMEKHLTAEQAQMLTEQKTKTKNKVFLGGTCNDSTWRDRIIPHLSIDYFNPVVKDWTPECQAEEERQKNNVCNIHLYVITPKMTGVFSIAEAVESAFLKKKNCVFCYLKNDGEQFFSKHQLKSLESVADMIKKHGGQVAISLEEVIKILNSFSK